MAAAELDFMRQVSTGVLLVGCVLIGAALTSALKLKFWELLALVLGIGSIAWGAAYLAAYFILAKSVQ